MFILAKLGFIPSIFLDLKDDVPFFIINNWISKENPLDNKRE